MEHIIYIWYHTNKILVYLGKIYINWETETGAKYRVRACRFMYTVFAAGLRSGDRRYKCTDGGVQRTNVSPCVLARSRVRYCACCTYTAPITYVTLYECINYKYIEVYNNNIIYRVYTYVLKSRADITSIYSGFSLTWGFSYYYDISLYIYIILLRHKMYYNIRLCGRKTSVLPYNPCVFYFSSLHLNENVITRVTNYEHTYYPFLLIRRDNIWQ